MANHHKQNGVHLERDKGDPHENVKLKSPHLGKQGANLTTAILSVLAVMFAIFCAAFRSSLLHHGQSFWISSGDFIARQWGHFYDYFEGNFAKMGIALHCLSVLEHWLLGGLFLIIDLTGRPKFITKYKVQLDQTEIPADKLRRTLWTVFLNQTIYNVPILIGLYYAAVRRGCGSTVEELPTFQTALYHLAVFVVVEEIGFYYSHRLLHHPFLYKNVHKMHHEWTAPIGLVTMYAHPVENLLANSLPAITGPLLVGSHLLTFHIWLLLAQYVSMIHHSGYHLPLLPSPEAHDYHHLKFNNNYGVLGILDWLHGTDVNFRKSKQFQRHKALLGVKPLNEVIPDNTK
ncbi:fatty acid hydroxylase domain-containing protein 2 isoform X2 [Strongylocentrotus purpuratus]|uniref:Fatty acid hydroxylase domain-containing protein n=1 Tax=Strongylocentrotus purpuratus TaxID=7668 RepID=A0A7M7HJT4_STRPU|nr:fatty acid hydroxylase domain-containing protein 2 isoform X2 [Strongylocentrotus purpuratus]|eukprot:XP_011663545.1 PREDICTED: fatty acid hydroxylase domain-containing protein 2 isoform X2 [Strongylocentrotus purpuratus]